MAQNDWPVVQIAPYDASLHSHGTKGATGVCSWGDDGNQAKWSGAGATEPEPSALLTWRDSSSQRSAKDRSDQRTSIAGCFGSNIHPLTAGSR